VVLHLQFSRKHTLDVYSETSLMTGKVYKVSSSFFMLWQFELNNNFDFYLTIASDFFFHLRL
jgi:hypothetical protein